MAGTVWLEERLSVCEIVRRWTCSTHAGSGLCGECHRRPCGVDQAVLYYWHCLWTSVLKEQDGAVVGVFLPLPSGPASSAHFRL